LPDGHAVASTQRAASTSHGAARAAGNVDTSIAGHRFSARTSAQGKETTTTSPGENGLLEDLGWRDTLR